MRTSWKFLMLAVLLLASPLLSSEENKISDDLLLDLNEDNKNKGFELDNANNNKLNNDLVEDAKKYLTKIEDENINLNLELKNLQIKLTEELFPGKVSQYCKMCAEPYPILHMANGSCVECLATFYHEDQLKDLTVNSIRNMKEYIEVKLKDLDLNQIKGRDDSYSILQTVNNSLFAALAYVQLFDYKIDGEGGMHDVKVSIAQLMPAYYTFMVGVTMTHMLYRNKNRGMEAFKVFPNAAVTGYFSIAILGYLAYFGAGATDTVNICITLMAILQQFHLWVGNVGFLSTSFDKTFANMMRMFPQNFVRPFSQKALSKIMVSSKGFIEQRYKLGYWCLQIVSIMAFSASASLFKDFNGTKKLAFESNTSIMAQFGLIFNFIVWLLVVLCFFVKVIRGFWAPIFTMNSVSLAAFMGLFMGIESISPEQKFMFTSGTSFTSVILLILKICIEKEE